MGGARRGGVVQGWTGHAAGRPRGQRIATPLDGLADFFESRCYFNPDPEAHLYVSSKDLMEAYTRWANEEGLRETFRASGRRLGQGAMARGARDVRSSRERGWKGVIVKDED